MRQVQLYHPLTVSLRSKKKLSLQNLLLQNVVLYGKINGMKVAIVTGGSRGIGAATVRLFAKNGYTVILNYNNSERSAQELQKELLSAGADVHLFRADVSSASQVAEMFAYVKKYFKHLDVLVNNAGVALSKLCQDVTVSEYDRVMNINARGTFLASQHAVEMFLSQGYGAIVNVSSIWGTKGASCESVYSMSKYAVVGLTKSLAEELRPSNITVNCVCPPIVLTGMSAHLSEEDVANFSAQHNVRVYTPEMVAQDVYSLATGGDTGIIYIER